MEQFIELLQSTEKLLKEADKNLQVLTAMEVEPVFKNKIQPVIEKYAQVEKVLIKRKEDLLTALITMFLITGETKFVVHVGACYTYEVSDTKIVISGGDLSGGYKYDQRRGTYSINQAVTNQKVCFSHCCYSMVDLIIKFIKKSPDKQCKEISLISKILDDFSRLEIPSVSH